MTTTTWARTVQSNLTWASGGYRIAQVPPGGTLLRVHFGWGFDGDTSARQDVELTANNLVAFGLVTTVGAGGGPPPDARTQSADQNPPSQRWIWWECRAPRIQAATEWLYLWSDSARQDANDTKGMVSASSVPAGQFLNLWASWAPGYGWDVSGRVNLWFWASALYRSP